jgi:hypothetical protein
MERKSAAEYDPVSCQLQCESRFAECPLVGRECLRKRPTDFSHNQLQKFHPYKVVRPVDFNIAISDFYRF